MRQGKEVSLSMCLCDNLLGNDRDRQSAALEASDFEDLRKGKKLTEPYYLKDNLANLDSYLKKLLPSEGGVLFSQKLQLVKKHHLR